MEPFSQLDIKVLRYDTRMSQHLVVDNGRSHDIHGEVFFVLEPLCMPFETTFVLRRQHAPEASSPVWHVTHTGSRVSFPPGTPRWIQRATRVRVAPRDAPLGEVA